MSKKTFQITIGSRHYEVADDQTDHVTAQLDASGTDRRSVLSFTATSGYDHVVYLGQATTVTITR